MASGHKMGGRAQNFKGHGAVRYGPPRGGVSCRTGLGGSPAGALFVGGGSGRRTRHGAPGGSAL